MHKQQTAMFSQLKGFAALLSVHCMYMCFIVVAGRPYGWNNIKTT